MSDEVFIEEFDVGAGSENVGAIDMVVEVANEVLSGFSKDVGDVLSVSAGTKDNDSFHSLYALERLTPMWRQRGSSSSLPR